VGIWGSRIDSSVVVGCLTKRRLRPSEGQDVREVRELFVAGLSVSGDQMSGDLPPTGTCGSLSLAPPTRAL
jgi:hypothetical protein